MTDPVSLRIENGIAVIISNSPPVNALSADVRSGLVDALKRVGTDENVTAVVLACEGRTFFAGADISEFGKPIEQPNIHALMRAVENCPKPLVAAIHGTALGGGFELALCCNYRLAAETARVGLPEVHLGILPGAGGTQRLPRLVGAAKALELIATGSIIKAAKALDLGMIDEIVPEEALLTSAVAFARSLAPDASHPLVCNREDRAAADREDMSAFDAFVVKNSPRWRGFKAQFAIVEAVRAAVEQPFEAGIARESELCDALIESPESRAQRALFFAERETARIPGMGKETRPRPLDRVGVVGAGTMGSGIALALLAGGLEVILVEKSPDALARGRSIIEKTIDRQVARGRMTEEAARERLGRIAYGDELSRLANTDLVIEAVFEDMALKKQIFAELDEVVGAGTILASNTSFLDINEIAAATARPEAVLGLHFFSPANIMRLLEIVRGEKTASDVLATAFALARKLGKVGVLSGVCDGFIANRLMLQRALQAEAMALEGTPVARIDKVMTDYGFAMGHFQMMDLAGLDVASRGQTDRSLMGDLVAMGRLGQKSGAGYYDYDDEGRPIASPQVAEAIAAFAEHYGVMSAPQLSDQEIEDRLLLSVVNEGAAILAEGIAMRASDIDVAAVLGYGWPVYRGGPMHWAQERGLEQVVETLRDLAARYDERLTPCGALEAAAARGGF